MRILANIATSLTAVALMASCTERPTDAVMSSAEPPIWPDIADVTIPADIAPLNFVADSADAVFVSFRGERAGELTVGGEWADIDIDDWHKLTRQNMGSDIIATVCLKKDNVWTRYADIRIHVSHDELSEFGLTYRKIAPGYETFSDIGIYQRDIHTFDEFAILTSDLLSGQCICCHTANRCNPQQLTLHVRGAHPATLVVKEGRREWLTTKTDSTICNGMYPYWHPTGNYCAYSLNKVNQSFLSTHEKFVEVFDRASDGCIIDVRTNELILIPQLRTPDMETNPVFSADGRKVYYCTAKPRRVPAEADQLRYDLCVTDFDPDNGQCGTEVDTILKVSDKGKSISWPRPSYDGRFLMYCLSDYGYFPVDHAETDLWMMDLRTGESHPCTAINSADTESFHNWNSTSRWVVFSSRRHDTMTSLAYIAHVDTLGNIGKPFLLPQRNPREYYRRSLRSFNCPDFTTTKVEIDPRAAQSELFSDERIQVTIKQ